MMQLFCASNLLTKAYELEFETTINSTIKPFESSWIGAIKWTANWSLEINREPTELGNEKILVELDRGWVAQISTNDDDELARNILTTLNTSNAIDCYWPSILEKFGAE